MKRKYMIYSLILGVIIIIVGIYVQHQLDLTKPASPIDTLRGNFATEPEEYNILFSFESEDHSFIQYHESTLVDEGTYEKINDNAYLLKSDLQDTYFVLQDLNNS